MNKEREKIDELIKETLNQEEAKFYDELEEHNLMGKLGEVYKSKVGWLAIIMNVVHLVIFGLLIYCIVQFFFFIFKIELLIMMFVVFVCLISITMLKLYICF